MEVRRNWAEESSQDWEEMINEGIKEEAFVEEENLRR